MIHYKDMTFCPFYKDCIKAKECHRSLTEDVIYQAKMWWGDNTAPIAQYTEKPNCHEKKTNN